MQTVNKIRDGDTEFSTITNSNEDEEIIVTNLLHIFEKKFHKKDLPQESKTQQHCGSLYPKWFKRTTIYTKRRDLNSQKAGWGFHELTLADHRFRDGSAMWAGKQKIKVLSEYNKKS